MLNASVPIPVARTIAAGCGLSMAAARPHTPITEQPGGNGNVGLTVSGNSRTGPEHQAHSGEGAQDGRDIPQHQPPLVRAASLTTRPFHTVRNNSCLLTSSPVRCARVSSA